MSATNSTVEFESLNRLSQTLKSIPEQSGSFDSGVAPSKSPAQLYFNKHQILENIEIVVNELAHKMPSDPYRYLQEYFERITNSNARSHAKADSGPELSVEVARHYPDETTGVGSPNSQTVETKLPVEEVDYQFASYLSNLASSVRRGTS